MAGMDIGTEVGQLQRDLASIKGDLGTLMEAIKDMGAERGQAVYAKAREAGEVVRGQAVQAQEQMGNYIETRPLTSVMVAFGTGFALGTLVGTRAIH